MCHRNYVTEGEPLRERIEDREFGREGDELATEEPEEATEPEEEERKPAVPTPSDD